MAMTDIVEQGRKMNTHNLVLCQSPHGWSLYRHGSTDEDIASGRYLISGSGAPRQADYDSANAMAKYVETRR